MTDSATRTLWSVDRACPVEIQPALLPAPSRASGAYLTEKRNARQWRAAGQDGDEGHAQRRVVWRKDEIAQPNCSGSKASRQKRMQSRITEPLRPDMALPSPGKAVVTFLRAGGKGNKVLLT